MNNIEPYIDDKLKVSETEAGLFKKVFISMPMKNKTNEQIEAKIAQIKDTIARLGYKNVEFIKSFFKDAPYEMQPLHFLAESLRLLADADIVYFAEDYNLYNGCKIERDSFYYYLISAGVKGYGEIRGEDGILRLGRLVPMQ